MEKATELHTTDYSYLRPSIDLVTRVIAEDKLRDDHGRQVWYNVEIDESEKELINEFLEEVEKDETVSLPEWWSEGDSLRYIHSSKNDIIHAITVIKNFKK